VTRTDPHIDLATGDKIWLLMHEDRFHLFNKKDGNRID